MELTRRNVVIVAIALVVLQILVLFLMGRGWIYKGGYVKLWEPSIFSSENSQQISDWYSFSHIAHGFIFYFLGWLVGRKRGWSLGKIFLAALVLEVGWEILENTPMIINHYRAATISLDYYGDSILNSSMDTLFMVAGFWLAFALPVWVSVSLVVAMELFVGFMIRDNLTLNIIMLLHPFKPILHWQENLPH